MGRRFRWILAGLIVGLLVGGAAYAGYNVAIVDSSSGDRWYACVSNTGVVRAPTLRLNNYPTSCPRSTDTIRTWNAYGPTGPSGTLGATGSTGETGATGATGTTPSGDGYGQFVGAYSMTITNQGCAGNELRLKLVMRAGRVPSSPLGDCIALNCANTNPFHVLNVGERCDLGPGSSPGGIFWGTYGGDSLDVTAALGLPTGQVYFLNREIEPNTNQVTRDLITFGTSSFLRTPPGEPYLETGTRLLKWYQTVTGSSYYLNTLPNLSGITEFPLLNLPNIVIYEVAS